MKNPFFISPSYRVAEFEGSGMNGANLSTIWAIFWFLLWAVSSGEVTYGFSGFGKGKGSVPHIHIFG
jgi:hypothetical protein